LEQSWHLLEGSRRRRKIDDDAKAAMLLARRLDERHGTGSGLVEQANHYPIDLVCGDQMEQGIGGLTVPHRREAGEVSLDPPVDRNLSRQSGDRQCFGAWQWLNPPDRRSSGRRTARRMPSMN
jgi:hypothetical protein